MAKKVLVVDDSAMVRLQVGATLTAAGFEVLEAVDGVDGAGKVDATEDLALVLCDVNMPNMNGLTMLETVRAVAKNAALPVVMLTTEGHPDLIARAKALGARAWLVKPLRPDHLVSTVTKLAR